MASGFLNPHSEVCGCCCLQAMADHSMARAIVRVKVGDPPHALQLLKRPKPPLGPGRVLVRITLRPVNPVDVVIIRTGGFFNIPREKPLTCGSEGFGIVEEVGEGVTKFRPGQRVIPLVWPDYLRAEQGTWQDYVLLSEDRILAVPDTVSDEAAAQFLINPWTLYGMLDDLAVPKGDYLLQTAAGSVLGRQLIQLAKHWGVKTINVVRRDAVKEELKALGADEVINSETEDVVQRVKEITGGKLVHGALDAVGGSLTKAVAASVRDGGNVFVYGLLSGWDITLSILDLMRGVRVRWWILAEYVAKEEGKEQFLCTEVMKLLEEKIIVPLVGKKFPLEDFLAAIETSEKESRGGKVLLVS